MQSSLAKDFASVTENYVEKHGLHIYFSDAVAQLLIKRKKIRTNCQKHFKDYFQLVLSGNHILHREFSFVLATDYNCHCFAKLIKKSMQNVASYYEKVSMKDLQALFQLLCPDFPEEVIHNIFRLLGYENTSRVRFYELLPYIEAYLPYHELFNATMNAVNFDVTHAFKYEDYRQLTTNVKFRLPKLTVIEEQFETNPASTRINFSEQLLQKLHSTI